MVKMTRFQILHVDNDLVQKMDLRIGDNIINRSVPNGWDDECTLRHAVTINVTPDHKMTITPVSPCYMKSSESSRWKLLELGTAVPIKCGDICSLVSNKCCFKIISGSDNNEGYMLKRKANKGSNSDISDKRFCTGEGDKLHFPTEPNDTNKLTEIIIKKNMNTDHLSHDITEVKMSDSGYTAKFQEQNQLHIMTDDVNKLQNPNYIGRTPPTSEKDANFNASFNLPSISNDKKSIVTQSMSAVSIGTRKLNVSPNVKRNIDWREKCKYGEKCYRRNSEHKERFSHPGDSDYDAPDNRKECPYGKRCYNKNPQHKAQCRHSEKSITSAGRAHKRKRIWSQTPADVTTKPKDSSAEESVSESVDESDYQPSSDFDTSSDDETCSEKSESELESDASLY